MASEQHSPRFVSASGVVMEWRDLRGSRDAFARFMRHRYEQEMALFEAMRKRHRDEDERRWLPNPMPSPEIPDVWEFDPFVREVQVRPPERSVTRTLRQEGAERVLLARQVVNPRFSLFQSFNSGRARTLREPKRRWDRNDLGAYCFGPHSREVLALLQPRCFFHGRKPQWERRHELTVLGRPAFSVPMTRLVPLADRRILGDDENPPVFDEAEQTEVVVDREYGIILEWRALFDGQAYERHFFTEICFNQPAPDDAFAIDDDDASR